MIEKMPEKSHKTMKSSIDSILKARIPEKEFINRKKDPDIKKMLEAIKKHQNTTGIIPSAENRPSGHQIAKPGKSGWFDCQCQCQCECMCQCQCECDGWDS